MYFETESTILVMILDINQTSNKVWYEGLEFICIKEIWTAVTV